MDTANYRPITHAPAWGKHLEKYLLSKFKEIDDLNDENHAYTAKKSIFSAITDFITAVQDVKRTNGGASGHTSLANGADRPVTNPEGFAAQEFGRRDNGQSETSVQCSTVHLVAFLPSSKLQLVIENTDSKQKNR